MDALRCWRISMMTSDELGIMLVKIDDEKEAAEFMELKISRP